MEIRIRETGQVTTDSEFRAAHPNVSFPAALTAELLSEFGADPVLNGPAPTANRYQTVYRDGVEQISGNWFTKFSLAEMDDAAKAAFDNAQAVAVRDDRNKKLEACDWTQLQDSSVDKAAWALYRQALRDVPEQAGFPWEVQWPAEPA
jgi:hypothetical protein